MKAFTPCTTWPAGRDVPLSSCHVDLSQPVLVARRRDYLWFPTLTRLANGDLCALMSNRPDVHTDGMRGVIAFSADNGLSWTPPRGCPYSEVSLRLPSAEQLFLPYYLSPQKDGIGAPYSTLPPGSTQMEGGPGLVHVGGWPRPVGTFGAHAAALGLSGFVFNGQTVELEAGGYLATLYGFFENSDAASPARMNLVAASSPDGVNWTVRSVIADEHCALPGAEGPCESALCRLSDGRLMSVFRMGLQDTAYGQCWSQDEGHTWTSPQSMEPVRGVQPSLAVLPDGRVVLSGGRPGINVWLNAAGDGLAWERLDLQAHHNACIPDEPILAACGTDSRAQSTCYTEIIVLDETNLLCIYDRLANGWEGVEPDSDETNSIWAVRLQILPTESLVRNSTGASRRGVDSQSIF